MVCASLEATLDPKSAPVLPPSSRLEAAALRLAAKGELRLLVSMVERWAQLGEPTPRAMLAQIEGFLDLCMMDRAWTRLQALPEGEAWRRPRLLLTARMFIERGWPRRARKVLDEALAAWPDDAHVRELSALADQPPRRAPAQEPEPDAPFEDQLAVAETWLATGAFLRARRLLEHLIRRFPDATRPADLLWALRGDYELSTSSLPALAATWGALSASEPGDLPDDPEPTDSVLRRGGDVADLGSTSFPQLFEDAASAMEHDELEASEITQASRIPDLARLALADLPGGDDREEDTQVLRVVSSPGAPMSREAPPDDEPPSSPGFADELEGEDEAVVQLTRDAERQPPQEIRRAPVLPDPGPRRRPPPSQAPQAPPAPAAAPPSRAMLPAWFLPVAGVLGVAG
ncbi:MAG TPA: hypothetical protein PKA64_02545, partial [Myxococcota bacterium]|nr:hypothetical protein [Myxococcota bacterium]